MDQLVPRSYAGLDLTGQYPPFQAFGFVQNGPGTNPAPFGQLSVPVTGGFPVHVRTQPAAKPVTLQVVIRELPVPQERIDELLTAFAYESGPQSLIAWDGEREWELEASVVAVAHEHASQLWTFVLEAPYGYWRARYALQDGGTLDGTSASVLVQNVGNRRTPPTITATPGAGKGIADYAYVQQVPIAWRAAEQGVNYTVFVQVDTETEVDAGRMLASGDDLRVFVDGVEVPRVLGGMNGPNTNVGFAANWSPARWVQIGAAITESSPATGDDWDTGGDTSRLPGSDGVIAFGAEAIHYTAKSADGRTLLGITRGVLGTTAVGHDAGETAWWVEHEVCLVWGYASAAAPEYDEDRLPIMSPEPGDSDNEHWTYSGAFATADGARPGEWRALLLGTNPRTLALRGQYTSTEYLPVEDNGTYNDGTPSSGSDNWDVVDDEGKYFSLASASGEKQSWVSSPTAHAAEPIASVSVSITARAEAFGVDTLRAFLRIGGTDYFQDLGDFNLDYTTVTATWTTNPATGVAWVAADVVSVEWGVERHTSVSSVVRVNGASLTIGYSKRTARVAPTADDGTYNDGVAVGESDRFDCVDDPWDSPANNDTDYIRLNTLNAKQTFAHTLVTDGLKAVGAAFLARKSSGATSYPAGMLRIDGVDWLGDPKVVGTSYGNAVSAYYTTHPNGTPWQDSGVTTFEWGVYANRLDSGHLRVTQMFLVLEYDLDDQILRPLADNGTYNDGTPHGAASVWETVDGEPGSTNDDTDYLTLAGSGGALGQTFVSDLVPPPAGSLISVEVYARAREASSGNSKLQALLIIDGEEYVISGWTSGASPTALSTSYVNLVADIVNNPATGIPWTPADLASLEWGVLYDKTGVSSPVDIRVTSMSLRVKTVADDDVATALGTYIAPSSPTPGKANADTWYLNTPCGVVGTNALIVDVVTGPTLTSLTAGIHALDQHGQSVKYIVVVIQGTKRANLANPVYQVQMRLVNPSGTTTYDGFAITRIALRFDPARTPLVLPTARQDLYLHRWTLANPNHPDAPSLSLVWPGLMDETLTLDAETGQVISSKPGRHPLPAVRLSSARTRLLELVPGTNQLQWSDAQHGDGELALAVSHRDRKA